MENTKNVLESLQKEMKDRDREIEKQKQKVKLLIESIKSLATPIKLPSPDQTTITQDYRDGVAQFSIIMKQKLELLLLEITGEFTKLDNWE